MGKKRQVIVVFGQSCNYVSPPLPPSAAAPPLHRNYTTKVPPPSLPAVQTPNLHNNTSITTITTTTSHQSTLNHHQQHHCHHINNATTTSTATNWVLRSRFKVTVNHIAHQMSHPFLSQCLGPLLFVIMWLNHYWWTDHSLLQQHWGERMMKKILTMMRMMVVIMIVIDMIDVVTTLADWCWWQRGQSRERPGAARRRLIW